MAEQTLWTSYTPALTNANDSQQYGLGTTFYADTAGWVLGVRWRFPDTLPSGSVSAKLWRIDGDDQLLASGTELASATFSGPVAGTVNEVRFGAPVAILANTPYEVSIKTPDRYVITSLYAPFNGGAGVDSGNLHAPANGADPIGVGTLHNGKLNDLTGHQYPYQTFNQANYWVDVIFTTDDPTGTTVTSDDTGTVTDGQTVAVTTADTDAATGTEGQSLVALMAEAETAVVSELQTLLATNVDQDGASMVEGWSLVVLLTDDDLGLASEAQGNLGISDADTASLTEAETLTVALSDSDSANVIDVGIKFVEGEEGAIPQIPITITRNKPAITIQRRPPGITIRG